MFEIMDTKCRIVVLKGTTGYNRKNVSSLQRQYGRQLRGNFLHFLIFQDRKCLFKLSDFKYLHIKMRPHLQLLWMKVNVL